MLCGARAVDGRDVVIRVLRAGSEGHDHLEVLKYMSRGATSKATPNHAVPLFELFELEDITFGVFPRIGCTMAYAYRFGTENSVGDVIDMVLQCLEVSYSRFDAYASADTPWQRHLPSCIAYVLPTEYVLEYSARLCLVC